MAPDYNRIRKNSALQRDRQRMRGTVPEEGKRSILPCRRSAVKICPDPPAVRCVIQFRPMDEHDTTDAARPLKCEPRGDREVQRDYDPEPDFLPSPDCCSGSGFFRCIALSFGSQLEIGASR